MEFKDFLRIRRAELDITQAQLAERLNKEGMVVSQGRVAHWETGRGNPDWKDSTFRQILARSLGLTNNEMMARLGFIDPEGTSSQEAQRAAYIIDRLPEPERSIALDFLEMLDRKVHSESS